MSYCTIAQLQQRYDQRIIAQVSNDTNGTAGLSTTIQAALDDATADVNLACQVGGVYSIADLLALTATGDTSLVRLCADLAMRHLARRRAGGRVEGLESAFDRSQEMLRALRLGQRILNVSANLGANVPAMVNMSSTQTGNLLTFTNTSFFGGASGTPTIDGSIP